MARIYTLLFFAGVLCHSVPLRSQVVTGFVRNDSIPAYENSTQLLNPWAGGMNFVQVSEIDLNLDGINDLFVFDRSGNKITTYLNLGTPNQVDYVVAPEYVSRFPLLHDWALLRDYNCDGKADIFSYSIAGFAIYKNISTVATGVQFQLEEYLVNTDRSPNSSHFIGNLFVSQIDIPAIRDIDGDGDLDVLTFQNGGNQVEYHKNMSMDLYGVCDSIKFEVASNCWGEFTENALNANITLNTSCPAVPMIIEHSDAFNRAAHSGSCLDCINTDGDNDQDLLLGDISSDMLVFLRNGGSNFSALIDSFSLQFPAYNTPVVANYYTCPFHLDVNNDGLKDVIVSPNAQNISENFTSVFYYRNTGTNNSVTVNFIQDDFLQETMFDFGEGAYPVFFDYDADGDQDLFVGNYGYYSTSAPYPSGIALLKNTGSSTIPAFTLVTRDFANLNSFAFSRTIPTFGDLDNDGDADMLIGEVTGGLVYFRKDPGPADNFVYVQTSYQGIDIGNYASPQLIDADRDGLIDLLIGKQNGTVSYYHNDGTAAAPVFNLLNAIFGGFHVRQPGYPTGYSVPFMYDDNNNYVLLVGSERGYIYRFDNIDGNLGGNFTLTDSTYVSEYEGGSLGVAAADLNGDSLRDVVIGNYAGGLSVFYGDVNVSTGAQYAEAASSFLLFPNPASEMLTIELVQPVTTEQHFIIYDLGGKKILDQKINAQRTNISIAQLPPGVYCCSMVCAGFTVNKKLVISR
jgi:hypothetical protein